MWPRWLRGLTTVWVSYDSSRRKGMDLFWVLVVLFLGPFFIPFYLASRPLLPGEKRRGSYLWNLLWGMEKLVSTFLGLATVAVFVENLHESENRKIAEVKRAEIKAGTILGLLVILFLFISERIGLDLVRNSLEEGLPAERKS